MATHDQFHAFKSVQWVAEYLQSPDWDVRERYRGSDPNTDNFNRETIRGNNGVQLWLELFAKPASPEAFIERTISLIKFGTGLTGFAGILHGGAILTLVDEALAYPMIANEIGSRRMHFLEPKGGKRQELHEDSRPISETLEGWFVTAKLEIKFLKPIPCPGVIGIETQMLEKTERKYKMRATVKDEQGVPLLLAEGVWVRIGPRGARL